MSGASITTTKNTDSSQLQNGEFLGVTWSPSANAWQTSIIIDYEKKIIGLFRNKVEAAIAYDDVAQRRMDLFPRFHFKLNFGKPGLPQTIEQRRKAFQKYNNVYTIHSDAFINVDEPLQTTSAVEENSLLRELQLDLAQESPGVYFSNAPTPAASPPLSTRSPALGKLKPLTQEQLEEISKLPLIPEYKF